MEKITTAEKAVKKSKAGISCWSGDSPGGKPETLIRAVLDTHDAGRAHCRFERHGNGGNKHDPADGNGARDKRSGVLYWGESADGEDDDRRPGKRDAVPAGNAGGEDTCGRGRACRVYTPVGVGTVVGKEKKRREIGGREYLLETALQGDVALIRATKADRSGNCFMRGATKNFGAVMAPAADYVVVEAEEIVAVGEIDPELVTVPEFSSTRSYRRGNEQWMIKNFYCEARCAEAEGWGCR